VSNNVGFYYKNYSEFSCYLNPFLKNVTKMDSVAIQIVPMGYRTKIPKDEIAFLKTAVTLYSGSNITLYWK